MAWWLAAIGAAASIKGMMDAKKAAKAAQIKREI